MHRCACRRACNSDYLEVILEDFIISQKEIYLIPDVTLCKRIHILEEHIKKQVHFFELLLLILHRQFRFWIMSDFTKKASITFEPFYVYCRSIFCHETTIRLMLKLTVFTKNIPDKLYLPSVEIYKIINELHCYTSLLY